MMRLCERGHCGQWAQWRIRYIEEQPKERVTTAEIPTESGQTVTKKLEPRGPKFAEGPLLCGRHKLEAEQQPSDRARKFEFVGAMAVGAQHS